MKKAQKTRLLRVGSLAMAAALLTACATPSPSYVSGCPQVPLMPAVRQPIPSLPYSASVRLELENWRNRLTATPAMSRP